MLERAVEAPLPEEALWRLRYIKTAQAWGWRLTDIARLLEQAEQSPNFCATVRETARRRIAVIDRTLAELRSQRRELEAFVKTCAAKPRSNKSCQVSSRT